jgi:hypothetical protein
MIILSISNSSEIVAKKVGKFLESLTPDSFDQAKVEDIVISKLVENLSAEGLTGEIAAVRGMHLDQKALQIDDQWHVRHQVTF